MQQNQQNFKPAREIKVRAWHNKLNVMLYAPRGYDSMLSARASSGEHYKIKLPSGQEVPFPATMIWDGRTYIQGYYQDLTKMLWTGLVSVSGIDAYYGDIIEHSTTEGGIFRRVISWSDELQCTMIDNMPYYKLHESGYIQPSKLEFEIIGNIYENPELVTGAWAV